MTEFNELRPSANFLHNERQKELIEIDMVCLVINNSNTKPGDNLEIDMEFKGNPEVLWDVRRNTKENTLFSRIHLIFDGSILTIRSREIHFKGVIPSEEKDRDLILGKAIRDSFECW